MKKYLFAAIIGLISLQAIAQSAVRTEGAEGQTAFEEMVKELEKPSRNSWQKPEEIMNLIRPLKNRKVLDLGCGTGYFSFRLIDSGATVIAADVEERMLNYVDSVRQARGISKNLLQTRKVPLDNPMMAKREVDLVLVVNTYHLLTNRVEYFRKVKAGLKSGGFVMIIDYLKKDLHIGPPSAEKLSADEVTRELKMAGFSQFKSDDKTLPFQFIVFAL